MQRKLMALLFVVVFAFTASISAQEPPSSAERLETLKLQLIDVQAKVEALRARVQQLDYDLKPENIERSLAGIGSTRPEELREHRRRQLTIERDGVLAQLDTLETQRARLEAAIADTESRAYQESASKPPTSSSLSANASSTSSVAPTLGAGLLLFALVSGGAFFIWRRRIR